MAVTDAHQLLLRSQSLLDQGKPAEALTVALSAIDCARDRIDGYAQAASALMAMKKNAEALELLDIATRIDDHSAAVHSLRGNALASLERFAEASDCHARAVSLAPESAACWSNRSITFLQWRKLDEALASAERAIELTLGSAELLFNRGNVRLALGQYVEAESDFRQALRVEPSHARALDNLGVALRDQGRLREAEAAFRRAIALDAHAPSPHWNLALALLAMGKSAEGWAEYEWRRQLERFRLKRAGVAWDGAPAQTLLVVAEQGLGDTLQFVRYLAAARARVQRLVLACQSPLVPLLAQSQLADDVIALPDAPADALFAPLMSLPHLIGAHDFAPARRYLAIDGERSRRWARRLRASGRFNIGITWQGNPSYGADHQRSMPLKSLLPLGKLPGVQLFSLQKHHGLSQLADVGDGSIIDLGPELDADGAFLDTAAVLQNLDLHVCSDSAIVHLAGALGTRVFMLLPQVADWRWGEASGISSWYESVRMFRQTSPGDWDGLVASVVAPIAELRK